MTHTPGPWYETTKGENDYQSEVAQEGTGHTIAVTYTSNDADARLIAEAPAMLEALQAIAGDGEIRVDRLHAGTSGLAAIEKLQNIARSIINRIEGSE